MNTTRGEERALRATGKQEATFYAGRYDAKGERIGGRAVVLGAIDLSPQPAVETRVIPEPGGRAWFVLRTQPAADAVAADKLAAAGYEIFRPMLKKEIRITRSRKWVTREFALFHGYLFAELPLAGTAWAPVYAIKEIIKPLRRPDGEALALIGRDLDRLHALMAANAAGEFDQVRQDSGPVQRRALAAMFRRRSRIKVRDGWLSGFFGEVVSVTGRATVKAMIETLSGLIAVELDAEALEAAG